MEIELGLAQSLSLYEILHPIANSQQLELRFEAEELLAQLRDAAEALRNHAHLAEYTSHPAPLEHRPY